MNEYQIDLIEEPPPKSPYFTLPDCQYFLTPADFIQAEKPKSRHTSLITLFGQFDKMSDDQQALFILTLIKHSNFQPDYDAMALALNITNALHVRRRFVAIAQKHGFETDAETGMVMNDDTPAVPDDAPSPEDIRVARKGKSRAKTSTPQSQGSYGSGASDASTRNRLSDTAGARSSGASGYSYAADLADAANLEDNME